MEVQPLAGSRAAPAPCGTESELQTCGDEVEVGGGLPPKGHVMADRPRRGRQFRIFQLDRGGRRSHDACCREAKWTKRFLP